MCERSHNWRKSWCSAEGFFYALLKARRPKIPGSRRSSKQLKKDRMQGKDYRKIDVLP